MSALKVCILFFSATASALKIPNFFSNEALGRRAATAAILGPALAACGSSPAYASAEAREALRQKAAARQAKENVVAAAKQQPENIAPQLDQIKDLLQGSQDWIAVRKLIADEPLANRKLTAAARDDTSKAQTRDRFYDLIKDVDQYAFECQWEEITGYQVGPDKKKRDVTALVKKLDEAKSSLSTIL